MEGVDIGITEPDRERPHTELCRPGPAWLRGSSLLSNVPLLVTVAAVAAFDIVNLLPHVSVRLSPSWVFNALPVILVALARQPATWISLAILYIGRTVLTASVQQQLYKSYARPAQARIITTLSVAPRYLAWFA